MAEKPTVNILIYLLENLRPPAKEAVKVDTGITAAWVTGHSTRISNVGVNPIEPTNQASFSL